MQKALLPLSPDEEANSNVSSRPAKFTTRELRTPERASNSSSSPSRKRLDLKALTMTARNFLKRALPPILVEKIIAIKKMWERRNAAILKRSWEKERAKIASLGDITLPPSRVVIIPSDQGTLFGSCGEDAMIMAAANESLQRNPDVEITVLAATPEAEILGRERGFRTASIWAEQNFIEAVVRFFRDLRPHAVFVVGADVIDGHYGDIWGVKLLVAADIAARMRVPVSVLGFSFNNNPSALIREVLNDLHPGAILNIRDNNSLDRFQRFTTANGAPVADSAFLLRAETSPRVDAIAQWAAERRRLGRRIIAFNIHPMLFPRASGRQIEALVMKSIDAISEASKRRNVSWLLMPHDFRDTIGDDTCLKPIMNGLSDELKADILYYQGERRASILKGVAAIPDGIVTARMHLAIAALGQGVPAACITYQDKFEGLFSHFEIPEEFLLSPSSLLEGDNLRNLLIRFYDQTASLQERVARRLPIVLEMSKKNFEILLNGRSAQSATSGKMS
jgi:polysaccharide pyruvyl transferase WcaK-like protein